MARAAFDDAVWIPGEPLDPSQPHMDAQETSDRLLFIEKALSGLQVGDLPLAALMKTLEQTWLPDPSTLFAGGAISSDSLAYTMYYGRITAAGAVGFSNSMKVSSLRNSAGNYTVTYPAFKTEPAVIALPQLAVTGLRGTATTGSANFIMSIDSDFYYVAVGK